MENKEIWKNLRLPTLEGMVAAIFEYLTAPFLVVFAIALGAQNFQLGLVVAATALFSLLGQIPSAKLVEFTGKRKIVTATSSMIARFVWVLIALIPFFFVSNWFIVLLFCIILFNFFMSVSKPAWISWMGDLVLSNIRGKYFGKRNRVMRVASLATLGVTALLLSFFPRDSLLGFEILFMVAGALGFVCFFLLLKTFEPVYEKPEFRIGLLNDLKKFFKNKNFVRFCIFFLIWNFAVGLATPFWPAYLVKNLGAHPLWVALSTLSTGIGAILTLKLWGLAADKFGNRAVLIICATGVALFPIFYQLVFSPIHVVLIQIYSGAVWAGFNLTTFNYQLDMTPRDKRPMYIAIFTTLIGIPSVFAPIVSGFMADAFINFRFYFLDNLKLVFLISGVLRVSSLFILRGIEEPRTEKFPPAMVFREVFYSDFLLEPFQITQSVFLKSRSTISMLKAPIKTLIQAEYARIKKVEKILRSTVKTYKWTGFDKRVFKRLQLRIGFEKDTLKYFEKRAKNILKKPKPSIYEQQFLDNLHARVFAERENILEIRDMILSLLKKRKEKKEIA